MRLSMKLSFIRFLVGDVFRESVIMVERLTGPGTLRRWSSLHIRRGSI